MNICILSGRIKGTPFSKTSKNKETKILSIVVETVSQFNGSPKKDQVSCVIFNCEETLESRLIKEGDPTPSEADIKVTRDLIRAGQLLKLEVLDHVIVGLPSKEHPRAYLSLRELGYVYS